MATSRLCSVPGCDKRHFGKGYCSFHYQRWSKFGDPLEGGPKRLTKYPPGAVCSISGCKKPIKGLGYCGPHYKRLLRHGDPTAGRASHAEPGAPLAFIMDTALPHVGDDCLIWPFANRGCGYGSVEYGGYNWLAHRLVCTLAHGEPPSPDQNIAAHSCGKGHEGCVSPKHLRWASMAENSADRLLHGTDLRGEKSPNAKITEAQAREIIRLRGKVRQVDLAKRFGISQAHISKIQIGGCWDWL